jgi:hypothetical protein
LEVLLTKYRRWRCDHQAKNSFRALVSLLRGKRLPFSSLTTDLVAKLQLGKESAGVRGDVLLGDAEPCHNEYLASWRCLR